jgi:hypothetical protein
VTWTLGQVIDRSTFEGIDEDEAIQIANQCYAAMVRRSGFLRENVLLGTATTTTYELALPANVGKVLYVRAAYNGGGGRKWTNRVSNEAITGAIFGYDEVDDGSFCDGAGTNPAGDPTLMVWPAAALTGVMFAFCELIPNPLASLTDVLVIPDEFVQGILDGIRAVVFREFDEDVGSAQAMQQAFDQSIADLADYVRARTVGNNPVRIPQRGVDW